MISDVGLNITVYILRWGVFEEPRHCSTWNFFELPVMFLTWNCSDNVLNVLLCFPEQRKWDQNVDKSSYMLWDEVSLEFWNVFSSCRTSLEPTIGFHKPDGSKFGLIFIVFCDYVTAKWNPIFWYLTYQINFVWYRDEPISDWGAC